MAVKPAARVCNPASDTCSQNDKSRPVMRAVRPANLPKQLSVIVPLRKPTDFADLTPISFDLAKFILIIEIDGRELLVVDITLKRIIL
jgi:hypothetical protein